MDRRGISPVIATVIIVAVAIAISIAVAFWMTGIVGLFTGFEQVQITYIYAKSISTSGNQWFIELQAKNTGTSTASIDNIFINGKPIDNYNSQSVTLTTSDSGQVTIFPYPLKSGNSVKIVIHINGGFSSGQSVEVKLHTASGKEYPKLVVLP